MTDDFTASVFGLGLCVGILLTTVVVLFARAA